MTCSLSSVDGLRWGDPCALTVEFLSHQLLAGDGPSCWCSSRTLETATWQGGGALPSLLAQAEHVP